MLTDFGLAKQDVSDKKLQKSFCGSPAYLAPEMLNRIGHNRIIDWYTLGLVMCELLVGQPPYYDKDREKLYDNIRSAQLVLPKFLSNNSKDLIQKV